MQARRWCAFGCLLVGVITSGPASPARAEGGADGELTCAASAARVLGLLEVASIREGDCAAAGKVALTTGTGPLALLPVRVDALHASTGRGQDAAHAESGAALVRLGLPGLGVEIRAVVARAESACRDGRVRTTTSGGIASVTINGRPIAVGGDPLTVPLGLATLRLNSTQVDAGGVTRRAVWLQSILGDVVVGEARAGVRGTPCAPAVPPEPASQLAKSVEDADGNPVASRDAEPGTVVRYRITYRNTGTAPAEGVTVEDTLDGVAFVDCAAECTQSGTTVAWALGSVPAGETRELTLRARVPASAEEPGELTFRNNARATDQRRSVESGWTEVHVPYAPHLVVEHEQRRQYVERSPGPYGSGPLAIDGVAAGEAGVGYRLAVRNDGTAPATDVALAGDLADAFQEPSCLPDPCTIEVTTLAPQVLEPGVAGTRIAVRRPRLAIGEGVELLYDGMLATGDYAQAGTVLRSGATVTSGQASAPVPVLEATAATAPSFSLFLAGRRDLNADGKIEFAEMIENGETVPQDTQVALDVTLVGDGAQAIDQAVVSIVLPPGLDAGPDLCVQAAPEDGCSYDAAHRTARLDHGRLGGHDGRGPRLWVRTARPFTGAVAVRATLASDRVQRTSGALEFEVR